MDERPTFGSLFAGIGGIDLGLERAGWSGRWQVEWDAYCQRVLAKHWPDVPRVGDIHDAHARADCPASVADPSGAERGPLSEGRVDVSNGDDAGRQEATGGPELGGASLGCPNCLEPVDLIAGGFPCQPFSNAGKRLGKADDRWLWPEFARVVGALRPRYVLVENVPGLLAGHGGMGAVLGDLAALGYDTEWDSIPASAVGAPHLRYRVWIVAYARRGGIRPDGGRGQAHGSGGAAEREEDQWQWGWHPAGGRGTAAGAMAHTNGLGPRRQAEVGQASLAGSRPQGAGPEPDGPGTGAVADADQHDAQGLVASSPDAQVGSGPFERPAGSRGDGVGWRATQPSLGRAPDGLPAGLDGPWGPGWEDGIPRVAHGVPHRVDRLRALGNAVVPQVVEFIGRRILEAEGLR